ncbi:MAG: flagellar hook-length control protein FliK [Gammaproteobacteria bacterium]
MLIIQPTAATVPGKHENLLLGTRAASEFRTGQLLEATILSNSRNGVVQLRIGTTELTAHTNVTLPKNAHIELKVMQLQPQLLLKILPTTEAGAQLAQAAIRQPLRQAMLTLLPRQGSPLPVLSAVSQPNITKALTAELPTLQPLLRQVVNALPTRNDMIQLAGLKQAIQQSGVFYEARLAAQAMNNQAILAPDIKALLTRLLAGYERAAPRLPQVPSSMTTSTVTGAANELVPPPLRGSVPAIHNRAHATRELTNAAMQSEITLLPRKLEAALARISLFQVATAENFNDGQMLWQLEIPVRQGDNVEMVALTIEREQHGPGEDDETWAVNLALDLPQLGALHIHISMNHEGIHSSFRTRSPESQALIESRLSSLREALEQQGLAVQSLNCRTETATSDVEQPEMSPLIDEQV